MSESETINFQAIIARIQTMVDNGLRVTLDLPEQAVAEVAQLMELKRMGAVLNIVVRWE